MPRICFAPAEAHVAEASASCPDTAQRLGRRCHICCVCRAHSSEAGRLARGGEGVAGMQSEACVFLFVYVCVPCRAGVP